ncbi:MAG: sterol desaturase family protein [Gammaproteobacteria bacterium]
MDWVQTLKEVIRDSGVKEVLTDSMGPLYDPMREVFWGVWEGVWTAVLPSSSARLFWLYILSTLAIALSIYLSRCYRAQGRSLRGFLEFFLPASIFGHRSAIVDYKFYFVSRIVASFVSFGSLIVSAVLIAEYCTALLGFLFGPVESQQEASVLTRFVYTGLIVVAIDAGFFIAHYLQHKVPFFWEFHKVHHSAEVLTPISGQRFHPVDKILQGFFMGSLAGITTGAFAYFFSNGVNEIVILNCSIVFFVYNLTANLRHSHIWLSYGWRLSHIFSSPAMHQIHHSSAARHIDKNFGLVFSFWDYLASTLYVPKEREDLEWGLKNQEHREYSTIWKLYVLPVQKVGRMLVGRGKQPNGLESA